MFYLLAALITLLILELLYFRIALHYNITDKPNGRSSHDHVVLRGAGILFPISAFCFSILNGFSLPYFMLGLLLLAVVSFRDDVKPVKAIIRLLVQLVASVLLLLQVNFDPHWWIIWPLAVVAITGIVNAWNFMDGINGLTAGISTVTVVTFMIINLQQQAINMHLMYWVLAALLVFSFYNMRNNARCFAGDAGSISIAFIMLYMLAVVLTRTQNPLYLLMFSVYGVDSIMTILARLRKGENIFMPHRQHLYQYLSNEMGWTHIRVTALYTTIQLAINAVMFLLLQLNEGLALSIAILIVACLVAVHSIVRQQILRKLAIR